MMNSMENIDELVQMYELGEKKFLKELLPRLFVDPRLINGFGHDASVVDLGFPEHLLVMKIDRAASPIASLRGWDSYRLWGRLAVTSNCNDILASGGMPQAVMLAVCVPPTWLVRDVSDIIAGCEEECRRWNVAFIGGDTKESTAPAVIGSAIGVVQRDGYLPRNGAQEGDLIVIAGRLGGYIGSYLQLLHRQDASAEQRSAWIDYVTHPTAKWREAALLRHYGGAVAGMDTSDGLYDVLSTMAGEHLGVDIDLDSIPYHSAALECSHRLGTPLFNTALSTGDWNIIYAVRPDCFATLHEEALKAGIYLTSIGHFTSNPGMIAHDSRGKLYRVDKVINEHFVARMEDERSYVDQVKSQNFLLPL